MSRFIFTAIYDKDTGEPRQINMSQNMKDAETLFGEIAGAAENLAELTFDEFEIMASERDEQSRFKHLIDPNKAKEKLGDRTHIDVPIEIEGIGGKEIIGYEQKPESIVTERQKPENEIETKKK